MFIVILLCYRKVQPERLLWNLYRYEMLTNKEGKINLPSRKTF